MAAPTPHTWTCPSCSRRVPLRADTCHCGMRQAHAAGLLAAAGPAAAAYARRAARGASVRGEALNAMGTDVKLLLAMGALVLAAGLGFSVFGPAPPRYPAVLGYVDAGPPPVEDATATAVRKPPFKLPWWK